MKKIELENISTAPLPLSLPQFDDILPTSISKIDEINGIDNLLKKIEQNEIEKKLQQKLEKQRIDAEIKLIETQMFQDSIDGVGKR